MAYGDSYSAVQGADLAERQLRQAAFQHGMATLVSGLQHRNNVQEANRNFAFQQQQYADLMKQQAWSNALKQKELEDASRERAARDAVSKGYLDLGNRQLDLQQTAGTPAQVRDREFTINRAASDAQQGLFDSPEHVQQLYPSISPEIAQGLFSHSKMARSQMEDNYNFASNAAMALNRAATLDKQIKDAKANPGWLFSQDRSDKAKNVADWTTELGKLQNFSNRITSDKRFHDLVTFDPNSSTYTPTVSPPPWMKGPEDRTPPAPPTAQNWTGADDMADRTMTPTSGTGTNAPAPDFGGDRIPQAPVTGTNGAPTTAAEPLYKMRTRDGGLWNIPSSKVAAAQARGAVIVQAPTQGGDDNTYRTPMMRGLAGF